MVSPAGFNALLKLVEEPPDHIKFVFATNEPEKVIGTIRSRTHHYPFRLIPPRTLSDYLQQLCDQEGVKVDPAALPLVGGKGANLGEMVKAGFPVPPGFCVTTAAFQRFITQADPDWLYGQLDQIEAADLDATRQIGAQIRDHLRQTPIPADIRDAVRSDHA